MGEPFVATEAWDAERPWAFVVYCSDGRWHDAVEEFLRARVSRRSDVYALPGGPAVFSPWSSALDEARVSEKAFRFLIEYHQIQSVWLIAHEGCAYYLERYGPFVEADLRRRQHDYLRRARQTIAGWYPQLDIHTVYASLEAGRVVLTTLPAD